MSDTINEREIRAQPRPDPVGNRLLESAWQDVAKPVLSSTYYCVQPGVSAIATRASILGLTGRLHYTLNDVANTLRTMDSPIGPQLAQRMAEMRASGWRFDALSEFRYLNKPPADGVVSAGSLNTELRLLTFEKPGVWRHVLGIAPHPLRQTTSLVAHELGHQDGIFKYSDDRLLRNPAQLRTMAMRTLASETNASLGEIHVSTTLGDTRMSQPLIDAVRRRELGGYIWDNYQSESMKQLTRAEAQTFVNEWIDTHYGPRVVDPTTGRVNAFDLTRERVYVGQTLVYDAEHATRVSSSDAYLFYRRALSRQHPPLSLATLSETRAGSNIMHGAKIAGAFGLFAATTDIVGRFQESPGSGVGRAGSVALGFAGFEFGTGFARLAFGASPGPVKILAAGFLGALAAERIFGHNLEASLQQLIDRSPRN